MEHIAVASRFNYKDAACFPCCSTQLKRSGYETADAALSQLLPVSSLVFSLSLQVSFITLFVTFTFLRPLKCLVFSLYSKILVRNQLGKRPDNPTYLRFVQKLLASTLKIHRGSPPVLLNWRFSGCKTADAAPFSTSLSVSSQSVIFTPLHILN